MKKRPIFIRLTFFILLIAFFTGCKKDSAIKSTQAINNNKPGVQVLPMQAYAPGTGEYIPFNMKDGSVVTLQKVNNEYVFGGDMILSANQLKLIRDNSVQGKQSIQSVLKTNSTFTSNFNLLWPNGNIYYTINDPVNQGAITSAINYWNTNTQIHLIARTSTNQANYVEFAPAPSLPGAAGDSQIGMVGGKQQIRLIDNIDVGSIIHEIGHTVGLLHEQTRSDRDFYINVNFNNISNTPGDNWTSQYQIYSWLSGYETGTFDFDSIMLYGSYYSSVGYPGNTTPQMTKKDGSVFYAQRYYLSTGDINGVNYLYFNHLFAKLRQVVVSQCNTDGSAYDEENFYVDFFQDAACTIPKTLTQKVRLNLLDTRQDYTDYSGITTNYFNLYGQELTPGAQSYFLTGLIVQNLYFTYDGLTIPGSYSEYLSLAGGVGYVVKF